MFVYDSVKSVFYDAFKYLVLSVFPSVLSKLHMSMDFICISTKCFVMNMIYM